MERNPTRNGDEVWISNSMDGTEDDELFSDLVGKRGEECESVNEENVSDGEHIIDDDNVSTEEEFYKLFGVSDDEQDF